MNNLAIVKQFLSLYQTQIPIDFEDLRKAVESADHKEIANKAHHVKPTLGYIGASSLHAKFQELEYAGKNKEDMASIILKFNILEHEYELLMEEINQYLSSI